MRKKMKGEPNFILLPLENDNFFVEKLGQKNLKKLLEIFQNSIAWMVLLEKRETLANRNSSCINLNFFNGLLHDYSA